MSRPIPVGVIGVGSMGENHARIYQELPTADLVGVADEAPARAEAIADRFGTTALPTEALIDRATAISIAVPTARHAAIARRCLEAGVHVLLEKPFVDDRKEGEALIQQAAEADLVLQVGHVERFNPAITALAELLEGTSIIACTAARLGPPTDRSLADDVVLDLMIHDLDVVAMLVDEDPSIVSARGTKQGDYVSALLGFPGETVATLTASRVTQRKVRRLAVTTTDRHIEVDYLDQSVEIHRRSRPGYRNDGSTDIRHRQEQIIERPLINSAEPLKLELTAFLEAIDNQRRPRVSGDDGLHALSMVDSVRDAMVEESLEVSSL